VPETALPATCPFVRRLIVLLGTDLPLSRFMRSDVTFRLLCELEEEAERYGASEPSKRAIARVRQWAGDSLAPSEPGEDRSRAMLPKVYRTIYYSAGVAVGWTSSASSLLVAVETAKEEMIRHGADIAQIIQDDGLGAIVWSSDGGGANQI
jgi:hypothetical protein